jgi:hypothetical protein
MCIAGTANGDWPPVIDFALDDPDVLIAGVSPLANTASSMCAGDVNGDGLPDLVVAACNAAPLGGQRQGEIYIIWGPALEDTGTLDLAVAQGQVSRIFGKPEDDPIFCGVECGDFNNDGFDDIIVGQPSTPDISWVGTAYVILGRSQFPDTLDMAASPPLVFSIHGHAWTGWLGKGMCACDLNGDGYDEVIVSAPGMNYAETYVIRGGESFQATYYTGQYEPGITRIVDNEWRRATGMSMACKDIDGDGCEDLLMGAPGIDINNTYDGRAILLCGRPALPDTIPLADETWREVTVLPEYEHGQLGQDVAIGDVDHDGQDDLIVAAIQADPLGCENCGEVYVLYNATSLPDTVRVNSTDVPITRFISPETHWFGIRVLVADLNNDGCEDMVIADSRDDRRARVSIVYGPTLPSDTVFVKTDSTITQIIEEINGTNLGRSLVSEDFDSDSVSDLVVGAAKAWPLGRNRAGAAYVLYGVASSTAVTPPGPPPSLVLKPNYPNPFSTRTSIRFELPRSADVSVTIYDVRGRRITTFVEPALEAGDNTVLWDGRDEVGRLVPSGIYFYRLQSNGITRTKKMVLLR